MENDFRVLIVDDQFSIRKSLELVFETTEWVIDAVESAEVGLGLIRKNVYQAAVVDKNLPGMNGVQFIQQLRKRYGDDIVIIMITGFASLKSAKALLKLSIDAYIEKPFRDIFSIRDKIQDAVRVKLEASQATDSESPERSEYRDSGVDEMKGANEHFQKSASLVPMQPLLETEPEEKLKPKRPVTQKSIDRSAVRMVRFLVASPDDSERRWIKKRIGVNNEVVEAASSLEAIARIQNEKPDVFVFDTILGEPSVAELLDEVSFFSPKTVRVAIVNKPTVGVITGLIDLGVQGLLEKPLDSAEFKGEISRLVEKLFPWALVAPQNSES